MSFEGSVFALNKHVIINGDMSSDLSTAILDLAEVTGCAVHSVWSGIPDGTIIISGSNTETLADFVPVHSQATGGTDGADLTNIEKFHYRYLLVQYTFNADTGTLNVYVSGKRI